MEYEPELFELNYEEETFIFEVVHAYSELDSEHMSQNKTSSGDNIQHGILFKKLGSSITNKNLCSEFSSTWPMVDCLSMILSSDHGSNNNRSKNVVNLSNHILDWDEYHMLEQVLGFGIASRNIPNDDIICNIEAVLKNHP